MIVLNGALAAKLFHKFVAPELYQNVQVIALPSTSPAHAAKTFEQKWQAWRVLAPFIYQPLIYQAKSDAETAAD